MVLACPVVGPAIPLVQMCDLGAGGGGALRVEKWELTGEILPKKELICLGNSVKGEGKRQLAVKIWQTGNWWQIEKLKVEVVLSR